MVHGLYPVTTDGEGGRMEAAAMTNAGFRR